MKIRLINKSYYNYLDLELLVPVVYVNKNYTDSLDGKGSLSVIEFNTKLAYDTNEIGWAFVISLLGFGIKLNRQFSY